MAEKLGLSFVQARAALSTAALAGWVRPIEGPDGTVWQLTTALAELGFKQLAAVAGHLDRTLKQSEGLIRASALLADAFGRGGEG